LFKVKESEINFQHAIERFRNSFLETGKHRSHKHISSPYKNSSAKRIIMFLRWMVRKDKRGVDFGIWKILIRNTCLFPWMYIPEIFQENWDWWKELRMTGKRWKNWILPSGNLMKRSCKI
jgi:hypothetical protein